jgi:hypothetical protein
MDFDPYGFQTLSCYQYKVKTTTHENLNLVTLILGG